MNLKVSFGIVLAFLAVFHISGYCVPIDYNERVSRPSYDLLGSSVALVPHPSSGLLLERAPPKESYLVNIQLMRANTRDNNPDEHWSLVFIPVLTSKVSESWKISGVADGHASGLEGLALAKFKLSTHLKGSQETFIPSRAKANSETQLTLLTKAPVDMKSFAEMTKVKNMLEVWNKAWKPHKDLVDAEKAEAEAKAKAEAEAKAKAKKNK